MTDKASVGGNTFKCTVISCPNYFDQESTEAPQRRFFLFPANRDIAKKWKEKCGIAANHIVSGLSVCSDHFKFSDFVNSEQTELKPDAIPRDNLGWMLGMPEIKFELPLKLDRAADFALIKDAVDTSEHLKTKMDELISEKKSLEEKTHLYKKKISNVDKEIYRLKTLNGNYSGKRGGWKCGNNLIFKVFSRAQINLLMGKKKTVWSYDDMAMAFTLRHLGNKDCYLYLKDTLNFPLPALSAVQRWAASNKLQP